MPYPRTPILPYSRTPILPYSRTPVLPYSSTRTFLPLPSVSLPAPLTLPARFHEPQRACGQILLRGVHSPPDFGGGGQGGKRQTERLDDEPAIVLHIFERLDRAVPVDLAFTGRRTIVGR